MYMAFERSFYVVFELGEYMYIIYNYFGEGLQDI